jgi:hypothetical protein
MAMDDIQIVGKLSVAANLGQLMFMDGHEKKSVNLKVAVFSKGPRKEKLIDFSVTIALMEATGAWKFERILAVSGAS